MRSLRHIQVIEEYYSFLITEFNLKIIKETINGNAFYDVEYGDHKKIISISYENIEDYFQIVIFRLQKGQLPNYDDKENTLHLKKLNVMVMSKVQNKEIEMNNEYFNKFEPMSELERKLLKSAKELRLCLKHINKDL